MAGEIRESDGWSLDGFKERMIGLGGRGMMDELKEGRKECFSCKCVWSVCFDWGLHTTALFMLDKSVTLSFSPFPFLLSLFHCFCRPIFLFACSLALFFTRMELNRMKT